MDADYTVENGVVVVNQDGHYRAMELFGGGSGDAYVDSLNALRSQLDSNINIYSMIAPLSCEFYLPANYADYSAEQKEYFDDVAQRLDGGIRSIDLIDVLGKHTGEAIYCRTDHHWMPLGAYYAAQAFANAAGVDFKDLSTFTPQTINGFVGTMYAFTDGDINIKNDPEDFTYHISDNYNECHTDFYDTSFNFDYTGSYFKEVGDPQSNAYLTFFGGDEQIVKIRTNVSNGKKLLIVKDSYGNAEPGYLMNSFEEIYIVDMRYFNLNLIRFVKNHGMNGIQLNIPSFHMVQESSGRGNDNLRISAYGIHLFGNRLSPIENCDPASLNIFGKLGQLLSNLHSKFSGRSKHNFLNTVVPQLQILQHGNTKGAGFPCSRWCNGIDICTRHHQRNCLLLNGRRSAKAHIGNSFKNLIGEIHLFKGCQHCFVR